MMQADAIVYWAITGIVGGAAGIAILIAAWLLKSHLALVREFDQFKGHVSSTYVTEPKVKDAVVQALKPLEKEVERLIAETNKVGALLQELAADRHIAISAARHD
jgi:hypothetical protein